MALRQTGSLVQVILSPLEDQIQRLTKNGQKVPKPVTGYGLIDTGASTTCIDQKAATEAGLSVVDSGPPYIQRHMLMR